MGWSHQLVKTAASDNLIRLRDCELRLIILFSAFDFLADRDTPLPSEEPEVYVSPNAWWVALWDLPPPPSLRGRGLSGPRRPWRLFGFSANLAHARGWH